MNPIKSICIYGASSTQIDPVYLKAAHTLGRLMAEKGITVVNGAGNMGVMKESTDGCMEAGGKSIGIIPTFMIKEGWCHEGMTEIVETPDMHIRQQKMGELSDAGIVFPGGCGTMAELMELITWKQLGLYLKPLVILNINGYYDHLLEFMQKMADEHFMRQQHTAIWQVATSPEEALQMVLDTPEWDINIRRFAAI